MRKSIVFLILIPIISACTDEKPKSFHECITQHVKPGVDKSGISLITDSCREQFPDPDKSRPLTPEELPYITGRASPTNDGNFFNGSLYNGNKNIEVKWVVVRLHYKDGHAKSFRDIRIAYDIAPLGTISFSEKILSDPGFQAWELIDGIGIPSK